MSPPRARDGRIMVVHLKLGALRARLLSLTSNSTMIILFSLLINIALRALRVSMNLHVLSPKATWLVQGWRALDSDKLDTKNGNGSVLRSEMVFPGTVGFTHSLLGDKIS